MSAVPKVGLVSNDLVLLWVQGNRLTTWPLILNRE